MKITAFNFFLCCMLLMGNPLFSQTVSMPWFPNLVSWENDEVKMKSAGVKSVVVFRYDLGKKIPVEKMDFDRDGFILSNIEYSGKEVYKHWEYEYSPTHHSYSWIVYRNGTKNVDRKSICDAEGYEIEGIDSEGAVQIKNKLYYNIYRQPDSCIGTRYGTREDYHFLYDDFHRMINVRYWVSSNEYKRIYQYDDGGNLVRAEEWNNVNGSDSSIACVTKAWYDPSGRIRKQDGEGWGGVDLDYFYTSDSITIKTNQDEAFGPAYDYVLYPDSHTKLVNRMRKFNKDGTLEEDYWYEYTFHD
jgi:hypothetical protein